jgi:glycosyltransferase involved in cell wall biosynthesis
MTRPSQRPLRVLRIHHAAVMSSWRARERAMVELGVDVALVSADSWNEGGVPVSLEPGADRFVVGVRVYGHHPNLFLYDPRGLWRALRARPVDVVDIHEEPVSIAAAEVQIVALLAGRRAPFALYSAQNIDKRYPVPFRWVERLALRRAKAVHTCNDAAGPILRRKDFRGIVRNLGLGVDVDPFVPGGACERQGALRVGYVGRLEEHKGVAVLVDAVAAVRGCTLEIVGAGTQQAALAARIASSPARDRITMVGYVPSHDLPDRYRGFDVLAVPSLDTPAWIEQFGRVAVEAMAMGVPVIASDSGALSEVVADAGILVPPGDVRAWACALERLAGDPAERERLSKGARARAEHYSWDRVVRRHVDLYLEMVADGR